MENVTLVNCHLMPTAWCFVYAYAAQMSSLAVEVTTLALEAKQAQLQALLALLSMQYSRPRSELWIILYDGDQVGGICRWCPDFLQP